MTLNVVRLETQINPGDDSLIAQVAARDEAAFRLLGERYSGLVFTIAFRMLNNRAGAEDVVQDVLIKLWNNAGDWDRARGASVKTWICRIATHSCIDVQRKRKRETLGDVPETADAADGAETMLKTRQTGIIVGRALQELPERQRLALVMFHYEDLSVADIATVLETSPKAAEGLLTRGRAALRQSLEAYKGEL